MSEANSRGSSRRRWTAWLLISAPPLWIIFGVARWGVDLPAWDQWTLVPLLELQAEGRLGLSDLAQPHNEHRLFFPRLIMVALAALSDWNVRWELLTNVALALALGAVLFRLGRETLTARRLPLFLAPASLLIYSPGQWENWAWGWQIQIFLSVLTVVAAVWLLTSGRWPRVALAVILGCIGSLSFGNVLLLWPLGMVLLWLLPERKRGALAVWALGAALGLGLFFFGYRPSQGDPTEVGGAGVLDLASYTLAYLGAPLSGTAGRPWLSVGVGLLATVTLVFLSWRWLWPSDGRARRTLGAALPWLALAVFAGGSAALTSLGRAERGLAQALTPRYVTIANLLWLGLLGAWLVWLENRPGASALSRRGRLAAGAVAALALFGLAHSYVVGAQALVRESRFRSELRELLVTGRSEELVYRFLFPLRRRLERYLTWLCHQDLGIFRDGRPEAGCDFRFLEIDPGAQARLDHPRGRQVRPMIRHGRWVGLEMPRDRIPLLADAFAGDLRFEGDQIVGWAVLLPELRSYQEMVVCLHQRCVYRGGASRQRRGDVVDHFSASAVRLAGFRLRLDEPVLERASDLRVFALRDGVVGEIRAAGGKAPVIQPLTYRLVEGRGGPMLQSPEESAPVVAGSADGQARLRRRRGGLVVRGWAVAGARPVAEVVVTVDGVAAHRPHRLEYRREIAEALGRPELAAGGFSVRLTSVPAADQSVRVFAINESGEAAELPIVSRR